VTEGDNTEPVYFEAIRAVFASSAIELVPHGAGRGDPRKLTELAIRCRKVRMSEARDKELSISQLEDFDQIRRIVFDTDVLKPDKRNAAESPMRRVKMFRWPPVNLALNTGFFYIAKSIIPLRLCKNVTT